MKPEQRRPRGSPGQCARTARRTIITGQLVILGLSILCGRAGLWAQQPGLSNLAWSTFLGGISGDQGLAIARDSSGSLCVAGVTLSSDFPTPRGYDSTSNPPDGFVSKFNVGGFLLWSTYLGGSDADRCNAIAIDTLGNIYVTGSTDSDDFPTPNGQYTARQGETDAFVAKFAPDGRLLWATYLGGSATDEGRRIAIDGSGNVLVVGATYSSDFPAGGTQDGGDDAFVAKFSGDGVFLWAVFLGGSNSDAGWGVATDGDSVYVAGRTTSDDFPTMGSQGTSFIGETDGFLSKLDSGGNLVWSNYFGGTGIDWVENLANDPAGNVYVSGYTESDDFPVVGGGFPGISGGSDAFVSKFDTSGTLVWTSFLAGSDRESALGVWADQTGSAYVAGVTQSSDFVTSGAYDTSLGGMMDGFVARLRPDGTLGQSTYFGGSDADECVAVAIDSSGTVYVAGKTLSSDCPTTAAEDLIFGGIEDAFVARFGAAPPPTPMIATSPTSFSITVTQGDSAGTQALLVWNRDSGTLDYQIATSPTELIEVVTTSGQSTGETVAHVVTFNTSGLGVGTHTGQIVVSGNADNSPVIVSVSIRVVPAPIPMIAVSPGLFSITIQPSQTSATAELNVWNSGEGLLQYTVETAPSWLVEVTPTSGESSGTAVMHTVDFKTSGLLPGDYSGAIIISGNAPNSPVSIPVDVTVLAPPLPPSPGLSHLAWSTFLGGGAEEQGLAVAQDQVGNVYVAGVTASSDFPSQGGRDGSLDGYEDGFVSRFTAGGNLLWSTYLGGAGTDRCNDIVIDALGSVYVTGETDSGDFPALNGYETTIFGGTDAFVSKFSRTGVLLWSTFLGGTFSDSGQRIAVDSVGDVYVVGRTTSDDFPAGGGYSGGEDVFVAKFNGDGEFQWANYLGGVSDDIGLGIAIDGSDNAYIAGRTSSDDFPIQGSTGMDVFAGETDGFVAKLDNNGDLLWSTYLGGSATDSIADLAVDTTGTVYVTGYTQSNDFPSHVPFLGVSGPSDGFVTSFDTDGILQWSSFLAGSEGESGLAIRVDGIGNSYVAGETSSSDFPTSAGYDMSLDGTADGFVVKLRPDGTLLQSTLLGGTNLESAGDIAIDSRGNVYVTGRTTSDDFPTTAAYDPTLDGDEDAFVARFGEPPPPTPLLGVSPMAFTVTVVEGSQAASQTLLVWNRTGGTLTYTVAGVPGLIDVVPTSGSSTGQLVTHTVSFNTVGLAVGSYNRTILVYGNAANSPVFVPVRITVTAIPIPRITVSPSSFSLTIEEYQTTAPQALTIRNSGDGVLQYTIATSPTWLVRVMPTSGQSTGQNVTHTVDFRTSGALPGTYHGSIVVSGNAPNSPTTIPVEVIITPAPIPMIAVSPGSFSFTIQRTQTVPPGTLNVWNNGTGILSYTVTATPSWLVEVTPGSGQSSGQIVTHTVQFNTATLLPGTHAGNITIAGNAPNSPVSVPVEVIVIVYPNLTVTTADVWPPAPIQTVPGNPLVISAFVENQGEAPAGPFWVEVWGSRTGGLTLDRLLAPSLPIHNGLVAGGAISWVTTGPLYRVPDGPYTVVYAADRPGQVFEGFLGESERDNRRAVAGKRVLVIRPQTQADVAVESFSLWPNPAQSGQIVTFSGRVVNRGAEPTGPFWIEFWGSTQWPYPRLDFFLCDSILVDNLGPGMWVDLSHYTRQLYALPAGLFVIGCFADRDDTINELDETNNYQFYDGQVFNYASLIDRPKNEQVYYPEILMIHATFSPQEPTQAAPGMPVNITVDLANIGTVRTGPFWVEYWGSRDGGVTLSHFLAESDWVSDLRPAQTLRLAATKTIYSVPDGPYTVVVAADRPGAVSELDESNNRYKLGGKRILLLRPMTAANLTIRNFQFNPASPTSNFSGLVGNNGTDNAGSFWIEFWAAPDWIDYPEPNFQISESILIYSLPPGGLLEIGAYGRRFGGLPAGTYAIICVVDPLDQVNETDETDNYTMVRGVTIGP